MSNALSRETLERIAKVAVEECVAVAMTVADAMIGPEGTVYGDIDFKGPEDFVAFYVDLQRRDVLTHLETIAPKHAESLRRRFEREGRKILELTDAPR